MRRPLEAGAQLAACVAVRAAGFSTQRKVGEPGRSASGAFRAKQSGWAGAHGAEEGQSCLSGPGALAAL